MVDGASGSWLGKAMDGQSKECGRYGLKGTLSTSISLKVSLTEGEGSPLRLSSRGIWRSSQ